jgi:type II secretory ATPase GspE/PulE/Tfp pilus assembly ATPase PilB-like protein
VLKIQVVPASVSPSFAKILPENLALEFGALAMFREGETLTIAISHAPSEATFTRIERATGLRVQFHIVAADLLAPEIARCYGHLDGRPMIAAEEREERTLAQYLDRLLERAVLERASDIHLDPAPGAARIRFRVDGRLRTIDRLDAPFALRLTSRVKLLAGLDISERRLPQDGRLSFPFASRSVDVRVASMPTESGERFALRIFDRESAGLPLDQLAFSPQVLRELRELLSLRSGFLIICGPTGSGKSTTLYALLRELESEERHLCTVEDPVEKILPGATQVPIAPKAGLTFAHALRALLRQDPDVVMIGEIRDAETAATALGAALAGQLVLTTVHGSDIARGVDRLCELGLSREILSQTLSGIMAQRLVRRLCIHCRQAGEGGFYPSGHGQAQGCEHCAFTGYRGRIVLADLLLFHPARPARERRELIEEHTLGALQSEARRLCLEGETSIDEIAALFLNTDASGTDDVL